MSCAGSARSAPGADLQRTCSECLSARPSRFRSQYLGTGFDAAERARLKDLLDQRPRPDSPLADDGGDAETRWTDPIHVAEVEYGEVTGEGRLRAPSYRRLVDDADPASVTRAAVR